MPPCKAPLASTTRQDTGAIPTMTEMGTTSTNNTQQGVQLGVTGVSTPGTILASDRTHPLAASVPRPRTPLLQQRPPPQAPTTAVKWRSSPQPIRVRVSRPLVLPKRPTTILSCSPLTGQEPVHTMASALCLIVNQLYHQVVPHLTATARYPNNRQGAPSTRPMFTIVTH